jgi:hypothetical protein
MVAERRPALVIEIVEQRRHPPRLFVLAELAGVAADGGFDRHGVLQQAVPFGVLGEQTPGVLAIQVHRFRQTVMITALMKSMKKAPTIGTTRNARGAGP